MRIFEDIFTFVVVNNLLEGKDEIEEGGSDLKMMEDLNTKGGIGNHNVQVEKH